VQASGLPNAAGTAAPHWTQHNFAAGVGGGAQMFAYDFDGNGANDVFTALAAHRYGVAVFLQRSRSGALAASSGAGGAPASPPARGGGASSTGKSDGGVASTWQRILLASEQPQDNDYGIVFSQPHAAHLADIDGDGVKDIVTGKRYWAHNGKGDPDERGHRVLYWYQTKRDGKGGVDFVPHLIDANSGVGVDVQVGDVNGDTLPDVVVGNKAGVFILTQQRKEISEEEAELLRPKKMYGAAASVESRRVVGQQTARKGDDSSPLHEGLLPQAEYAKGQSPQEALKKMQLPGGFKAELIAAEPDVVQPIAFTFDERGRIWVVEGNSYPQRRVEATPSSPSPVNEAPSPRAGREAGAPPAPDEAAMAPLPRPAGLDRIKILEDKDGDGTFETKKIFCEGLNLVSGIELGFGGVWVGAAPYLMFIPRDGDRPIERTQGTEKTKGTPQQASFPSLQSFSSFPLTPDLPFTAYTLLDGWGYQDTHETLNSFIWGPDGWLYGCHGVFTHSRVGKPGTPDDQREPINAGVWRYHPVRHEFEIFAHGTSNPWGLDYDQHGEWFVTACVIPHLYHIVPGGRYQRQAGQHFNAHTYEDIKTIADHAHYAGSLRPSINFDKTTGAGLANDDTNALGGGHAHCGLAIYQSSLFPPTYRNQLLFGNLHGHRLVANYTDVKGSTYIGKHAADFMRANDMHFIPVTQKVGPDGALYVSDWSDQQICHRGSNAVEHWDRSNGRIYRVTYAVAGGSAPGHSRINPAKSGVNAPGYNIPAAPFDLAKESDETLAKLAVQTENEWFSRMARRVLMEKGTKSDLLSKPDTKEPSRFAHELIEWHAEFSKTEAQLPALLRATWLLAAVGMPTSIGGEFYEEWKMPEARAWAVRLMADGWSAEKPTERFLTSEQISREPSTAPSSSRHLFPPDASGIQFREGYLPPVFDLTDFAKHTSSEQSPKVRREIASMLHRMPVVSRQPLATALLKHGEDKDDPMIPLLIWYGIEPLVAADAAAGLQLAKVSKMPKVTGFIYRRLASEGAGRDALLRVLAGLQEARMASPISSGGGVPPAGGTAGQNGGTAPASGGSTPPNGGAPAPSGGVAAPDGGGVPPRGGAPAPSGGSAGRNGGAAAPQNSAPISAGGSAPASGGHTISHGGDPKTTESADSQRFTPAEKETILTAIVQTARGSGKLTPPADWPTIAAGLRAGATPRLLGLVRELAALFGDAEALGQFRTALADGGRALGERQAALSLLIQAGDTQTATLLQSMVGDTAAPTALRRQAIQALASLKDAETPRVLGAALPKLSANELPDAINTLASTKEGAKALLRAAETKTIPASALSPFLVRQLTAFDDAEINALIKSAWGDVNAPKADLAERTKKYRDLLTPAALAKGDLAKGKALYMGTCGACHKLLGEGQNVGPDITGSNRGDLNYLLENVLDPNAVIGKDYQLNLFTMTDGRVMGGVVREESAAAVRIAMMGGVEFTLPKADIAKREVSKLSTMPEGLFDALPPESVVDLVKYLQSGSRSDAPVASSGAGGAPASRKSGEGAASTSIPGTLEGESLKILEITGGSARKQAMGGFGNQWSGGAQLWWTGGKPDHKLTLAIPVKEAGRYTLYGALTMARDYGVASITLDGKPVASSFDGFNAAKVIHTGEKEWGTHELSAGEHQLTFTLATPNPDAVPSNMVGIDYVRLERK
jgi:putative membrane-bound dehydrogenase-like protein